MQPDINLAVENFPFFNFSPSIKGIFPAVKVLVGTDLLFSEKKCLCVIISIYDGYSLSGKWPCVMNINFLYYFDLL